MRVKCPRTKKCTSTDCPHAEPHFKLKNKVKVGKEKLISVCDGGYDTYSEQEFCCPSCKPYKEDEFLSEKEMTL